MKNGNYTLLVTDFAHDICGNPVSHWKLLNRRGEAIEQSGTRREQCGYHNSRSDHALYRLRERHPEKQFKVTDIRGDRETGYQNTVAVTIRKGFKKVKLSPAQRRKVELALANHARFQNCYNWRSVGPASTRRKMEKECTFAVSFTNDGNQYRYESDVSVSCSNVYYNASFYKNGERKNVRLFKTLV